MEKIPSKNEDGLQQVYKMAKQCKSNRRNIVGIPYIHGNSGNLKIALKDKMQVWKKFEKELF